MRVSSAPQNLRQYFYANVISLHIEWFLYFLLTTPESSNSTSVWKELMPRCYNKHGYAGIILKVESEYSDFEIIETAWNVSVIQVNKCDHFTFN